MSEREVSEKEIDEKLNEISKIGDNEFLDYNKTLRFFAKLLFNIRYDIDELKAELLKVFKEDEEPKSVKEGECNDGELYS